MEGDCELEKYLENALFPLGFKGLS